MRYRRFYDGYGRYIIECVCSRCGRSADYRKHCLRPERSSQTVMRYATLHAHGARLV